jgi:preprotein translocase subunit SecE
MNKITSYFRESYRELLEKVTWPTWQQLQQSTMIVLVATLFITFIIGIMDAALANKGFGIMTIIYKLFK